MSTGCLCVRGGTGRVGICCSAFGVTPTLFPPLGLRLNTTAMHRRSTRRNKEINKPSETNLSPVSSLPNLLSVCPRAGLLRFIVWGLRSDRRRRGWWLGAEGRRWLKSPPSSFFPFLLKLKIDFFSPLPLKAFGKASTVQMTCSEAAPLHSCMVMRDVQLNELCE